MSLNFVGARGIPIINIRKKSKQIKEVIMNKVKIGDKIKIINMKEEPQYTDREGVVTHIDDAGQIHGTWGGCAIIPEIDEFLIIESSMNH
jgi:hypothetical protein